jgi:endonuclease YncB( thermonuclease family)
MSPPPNEPRPIPHAGRPRGEAWRELQREDIEWEGQVLIGADEHVLSARLIITSKRLAFARGGEVVLDISRWWLKRPPYLSGNGAINLRIETGAGQRDRLQFTARDGREAATDIVTLLTHGRQALPSAPLDSVFTNVPPRRASRTVSPGPDLTQEPAAASPRLADEHKYTADVIDATTLQVLGTTDFPPVTETQTPSTHLDSTADAGRLASDPILISTLANQSHRSGEWSLNPIPSLSPRTGRSATLAWAFRLSGLIALIALAAAFGSNRLPDTSRLTDRGDSINAPDAQTTATSQSVAQVDPTATLALEGADEPTREAAETAVSLGVGGETVVATLFPPTATPTATETATETPTATATTAPTEPALSGAGDATEKPAATETPTQEPTPLPTDTPTLVPTDTPTIAPATNTPAAATAIPVDTATTAPVSTDTATSTPVETDTPAPAPVDTATPTLTATPVPTATETPEPTPTADFPAQGRTVAEGAEPEQVFSTGAFRYTVEYAQRGAELPALELPAVAGSEWIVIVLHAWNWSDEPATLNMADFQLLVSGGFGWQFVGMDARSPEIARYLGFDPVLQPTELRSIKDGEGIRLALVYLIPPATTGMELIDDTSGLNIAASLAAGGDVTNLGPLPEQPQLLSGTVTEVIDGRTIVIESADGETATIQYLGIDVPTNGECYSAEATALNTSIVLGQTVYLERQFRNRVTADEDLFARDVWIDNKQGGLVLVSAWLASEGAAAASPDAGNARFAGWIQAAAEAAQANVLGFWAVCGGPPAAQSPGATDALALTTDTLLPIDPLITFSR